MPSPPNVLVIHPHNLGQYLGCYGRDVSTPAIDSLAQEGVCLENSFCTAPHCSPARGSLWTGRYPHRNGLVGLSHLGWSLNDGERTLMEYLQQAGYTTRLFGVQHIAEDPHAVGFDHVDGSQHDFTVDEPARDVAARVGSFLRSEQATDDRWFASVGFSEVHREPIVDRCLDCGWSFDLDGYDAADPDEIEPLPYLPDDPRIRADLADFHGMVAAIDEAVGTILDELDSAGLTNNTIVTFTTDHGIGFPRAMGTCYDPGVHTAWITRWPGKLDDRKVEGLASGVDFLPTMLDLVDEPVPSDIDGQSLVPLLSGACDRIRDRVFLECTWHSKYNPIRAVRTERYKYIKNIGDLPAVYIPAPVFSSRAGKAVRNEYYRTERPAEELYALEDDPLEQENLIGNPTHEETHQRLNTALQDWMEATDDRLLNGRWPPTEKQRERVWKSPWIPQRVDHGFPQ